MTHEDFIRMVRIKKKELGLTNMDIAEKLEYDNPNAVSNWLTRKVMPTLYNAIRLAEAVELDLVLLSKERKEHGE